MERMKIAVAAQKLGVTAQAIYKRLKPVDSPLRQFISKESGTTYLSPEGFGLLETIFANKPEERDSTVDKHVETLISTLRRELDQKQETISALIAKHSEERKRSDVLILKLSQDLQRLLEAPKVPEVLPDSPPAVRAWVPPEKKEVPLSWIERAWFSLWEPERLRA